MSYTNKLEDLSDCNIYIITVPTPIDHDKKPDFAPLVKASKAIGSILKIGDIVIYESTVYPGATEELCSNLKNNPVLFNDDFSVDILLSE